jgi:hypothetical protein
MTMTDPPEEPTQETQPKKGPASRIPIPTRKDFFRDLAKVAKPRKSSPRLEENGDEIADEAEDKL